MPNLGLSLQWMYDRLGKVYYSMVYRLGQIVNGRPNFDCSSAQYFSLIQGSFLPANTRIGNTDSLFYDLEHNGFVQVTDGSRQAGDRFIWGKRGASGGAAGHTGTYVDSVNVIHCSSGYNGIHVDNYKQLAGWNENPEQTIYRYVGKDTNSNDQDVNPGSYIKFSKVFTVDEVKEIDGIWQVRTNELCPVNFTWEDNGIPTEPLYEVDGDGYATVDQDLNVGSKYVIPGSFEVLDVGPDGDVWLALIEWNGLKFWVDLAVATEIAKDAPGTATPTQKPQVPTTTPPVTPPNQDDTTEPPTPPETNPKPTTPDVTDPQPPISQPENTNSPTNPKEEDMAFPAKDQKKLASVSKDAQEFADLVAASQGVQDIVSGISKKTKVRVYIIGDSLIGLGVLIPQAALVFGWGDVVRIVAASGLAAGAGGFLLTMFGIYSKGTK